MEKSIRILCIGDPHFRRDAIPEGISLMEAVLKNVDPELSLAVVMGDTLDRFGDIKTAPLTLAIEFLQRLHKKVRTVLIIGNHDLPHKCCDPRNNHPFTALHNWGPNMTVVDHPLILEVEGVPFTFAPYYEPGALVPLLERQLPSGPSSVGWLDTVAVFGHQELHCISYTYNRMKASEGLDIEVEAKVQGKDEDGGDINTKTNYPCSGDHWKSHFPLAVMGHIHDHCRPLNNVLYVGSSMQRSYSESPDKTISLLTFNAKTPESRDLEETPRVWNWEERRIDLGLQSLRQATIHISEVQNFQVPSNCKFKLNIKGTAAEISSLRSSHIITRLKEQGVKVSFTTIQSTTVREDLTPQRRTLCYGQLLASHLTSDPELYQIFTSLFGTVQIPNSELKNENRERIELSTS